MELKDTIELMQSEDYKERFMAEHQQLIIRYKKLKKMYDNWNNLSFVPRCPKSIYKGQQSRKSLCGTAQQNNAYKHLRPG